MMKKKKYEKPKMEILLDDIQAAVGACAGGNGDSGACGGGNGAARGCGGGNAGIGI